MAPPDAADPSTANFPVNNLPANLPAESPNLAAERDLIIAALREAAPLAMAHFRPEAPSRAKSWKKADGSGVTEADLAVNAALKEILLGARPDCGWLSEEEADEPSDRLDRRRAFIVDPIDGTRSFMEGSAAFCFSVALVEAGRPVAAAVYAPAMERLFDAAHGVGARLDGASLPRVRPETASPPRVMAPARDLEDCRWAKGAPPARRGYLQPIAHRLCRVAASAALEAREGGWDGLIALKATSEWDVAAADLIAREAGLTVTDRAGRPLAYNNGADTRMPGLLAAPAALHREWLARGPKARR